MTKPILPIKAVFFDWAGTTVDFGSIAPTRVFVEIFRRREISITVAEARGPMGRAKWEHIAALIQLPHVARAWKELTGRAPEDRDIDELYREFLPLQRDILSEHADVIPGVPEVVAELRRRGIKIGSSTGYSRELMSVVIPLTRAQGYEPDVVICADDVPAGRPAPWMNFLAAQRLNVYPLSSVLVVDDTPVGIEAGKNAGAITVAVTHTGNALGLSAAEFARLSGNDLETRTSKIAADFLNRGADFVISSVGQLLPCLDALG